MGEAFKNFFVKIAERMTIADKTRMKTIFLD
jgi:hypothetical protein